MDERDLFERAVLWTDDSHALTSAAIFGPRVVIPVAVFGARLSDELHCVLLVVLPGVL
jgi:hypothetical protein